MIKENFMRIKLAVITTIAAILWASIFCSCFKTYGRFAIDAQVYQDFKTGRVYPEFQYYYAGRSTIPYAIIGIDRSYTVLSRYWIPFEPDPAQLKKMSGQVYEESPSDPYGARILDTDGNMIGFWFSNIFRRTVQIDEQKRTAQILFINPEVDDRHPW
jgi:hypothetical protein